MSAAAADAGQRPEIQQQQQRRQRDDHRLGHQAQGKKHRHQQIARQRPAVAHIAEIGPQREHEKQSAQHVFPLGHPGHRLDVLRMDGEDRGDEGAGPKLAGHSPQNEKQRDRRGGVEQHIGQMMPPGVQAEELAIEHVRQRGQRIPLAVGPVGEGPPDAVAGQARGDMGVSVDKDAVVVISSR